jgi:hypothetical protein
MAEFLAENKGTRIRKTTVMVKFAILSQNLFRGTVENHEKFQQGYLVYALKHKPETSQLEAVLLQILPQGKGKAVPDQTCYRPLGFQDDKAPRFQDNRHMKVVRLSDLHTGRLYPPGNIPGTHFC